MRLTQLLYNLTDTENGCCINQVSDRLSEKIFERTHYFFQYQEV